MSKKNVMQQLKLENYFSSLIGTQGSIQFTPTPPSSKFPIEDQKEIERTRKEADTNKLNFSPMKRLSPWKNKEELLFADTQVASGTASPYCDSLKGLKDPTLSPDLDDLVRVSTTIKGKKHTDQTTVETRKPTPMYSSPFKYLDDGLRFEPLAPIPSERTSQNSSVSKPLSLQDTRKKSKSKMGGFYKKEKAEKIEDHIFEEEDFDLMRKFREATESNSGANIVEIPMFNELTDSMELDFIKEYSEQIMRDRIQKLDKGQILSPIQNSKSQDSRTFKNNLNFNQKVEIEINKDPMIEPKSDSRHSLELSDRKKKTLSKVLRYFRDPSLQLEEKKESQREEKSNSIDQFRKENIADQGNPEEESDLGFKTGSMKEIKVNSTKLQWAEGLFGDETHNQSQFSKAGGQQTQRIVINNPKLILQSQRLFDEPQEIFSVDLTKYRLRPPNNTKITKLEPEPPKRASSLNLEKILVPFKKEEKKRSIIENEEILLPTTLNLEKKIVSKLEENSQQLWPEQRKNGPKLLRGNPKTIKSSLEAENEQLSSKPEKIADQKNVTFKAMEPIEEKKELPVKQNTQKSNISVSQGPVKKPIEMKNSINHLKAMKKESLERAMRLFSDQESRDYLTPIMKTKSDKTMEIETTKSEEEIQQTTKRILSIDLRHSLSTTNKVPVSFNIPKPNSENTENKTPLFKFSKDNSRKWENLSDSKENSEKKEPNVGIKRKFDALQKSQIKVVQKIDFSQNLKIKKYKNCLKIRGGNSQQILAPQNSYFSKDNRLKSGSTQHKLISLKDAKNTKVICNCINNIEATNSQLSQGMAPCICNGDFMVGWQEIRESMIEFGCSPDHVTENWIQNHYRLIVWKLSAIQNKLKAYHPSKQLSYQNVRQELEYRYFIEYCEGKRSPLNKILNKDKLSGTHMVLLVGEIQLQNKVYLVELTDGWYSFFLEVKLETTRADEIQKTNNQMLLELVKQKKLYSGLKVHVSGMKILRKDTIGVLRPVNEGDPSDPNQMTIVSISYNSISRAKWNEKLGVCKKKQLIKNLVSLRNNGGEVPMVDVFILKKYKILEKTNTAYKIFNETEEKSMMPKLSFKIRVADAISYYAKDQLKHFNNIFCEIEIIDNVIQVYDEIAENSRIRFYGLKGFPKYDKSFKYYEFSTKEQYSKYLYLQYVQQSRFENLMTLNTFKDERKAFKDFCCEILKANFLLSSIQFGEDQSQLSFFKKDIKSMNNELDVIGIILESDCQKAVGVLSSGYLFKLLIHSKAFFPNLKLLDKRRSILTIRNVKINYLEKIIGDNNYCFNLVTTENSYISASNELYKSKYLFIFDLIGELANLEFMLNHNDTLNKAQKSLDKLLKRIPGSNSNSNSIDMDLLENLLLDEMNKGK